jgi:hypothetical protein
VFSSLLNIPPDAFVIDSTTDAISGASLSAARSGVAAVTATDGTAWFAGGIDRLNKQVFDNVDVFSKTLAVRRSPQPRSPLST